MERQQNDLSNIQNSLITHNKGTLQLVQTFLHPMSLKIQRMSPRDYGVIASE